MAAMEAASQNFEEKEQVELEEEQMDHWKNEWVNKANNWGHWKCHQNGKWYWLPCCGGVREWLDEDLEYYSTSEGHMWVWWPAERTWSWALEGPPEWCVPLPTKFQACPCPPSASGWYLWV